MKAPSAFKHQDWSITFQSKTDISFDASDPGTGKTYVQIVDFAKRRRKKGKKAIVFAPKSLLEVAWQADFRKFAPDMYVVCAFANNREKVMALDADVYVLNHDAAKWLATKPKSFFKDFDTLIIDESGAFKHHTSARSKAMRKIAEHFKYKRCMNGTPATNGITDIWHQVYILDKGKRLGPTFSGFRNAACIPQQVGSQAHMIKWIDRPGIENVVATLLKDILIRHRFEDCVDIPPNFRYAREFELNKKHLDLYKQMEKDSILEMKGKVIDAVNGAVLYGKLLQIASGAVYNTDGSYSLIDSDRYELIMELIEEREHCVVFFNWEHQRDHLIELANSRGFSYTLIDGTVTKTDARRKAVEEFQSGRHRILFAHPQSAGHGLTLTRGSATIWASPTHNLEHFLQGLKRVHRIGQDKKTETIVVVARGTIDEHVWNICQQKDARQGDLLTLVEEMMK